MGNGEDRRRQVNRGTSWAGLELKRLVALVAAGVVLVWVMHYLGRCPPWSGAAVYVIAIILCYVVRILWLNMPPVPTPRRMKVSNLSTKRRIRKVRALLDDQPVVNLDDIIVEPGSPPEEFPFVWDLPAGTARVQVKSAIWVPETNSETDYVTHDARADIDPPCFPLELRVRLLDDAGNIGGAVVVFDPALGVISDVPLVQV